MQTTWELQLKGNSSAHAKRAAREVSALLRVMRDLKDVAPQASAALATVAGPSTIRNLRTQLGLLKQTTTELRRMGTEQRRATRAPGQRAGAPGLGGRTRQDGVFSLRQQEQLRGMRQRGLDREAQDRRRANSREVRENAQHFRRVHNSNVRAQEWGRRRNEREAARQQRQREGRDLFGVLQRSGSATLTRHFGGAGDLMGGAMGTRGLAILGAAGAAVAALTAVAGAMISVTRTTFELAGTLASVAFGAAQLIFSFGRLVAGMAAFRESTLMTLATLSRAGTMEARQREARGEYEWARNFARETPLDMQQVVTLRTQAATAGLQGNDARTLTSAAADAGALHPNDSSTASRFILQMGQLRNSSVARSTDYRPAAMAAGVSETAAIRRAAIAAGVVQRGGENEAAYQQRIRTAQGNGQITGRQMYDAILAEQRSLTNSQNSGDFARSQSQSIAAVLSNLEGALFDFVTGVDDLENLSGIRDLRKVLGQVVDIMSGATANGKRLQAYFGNVVDLSARLAASLFPDGGKGGLDAVLGTVLDTARDLAPFARELATVARMGFMEGFGPFLAQMRRDIGAITRTDVLVQVADLAQELGLMASLMLQVTAATITMARYLIRMLGMFTPGEVNPGAVAGQMAGGGSVGDAVRENVNRRVLMNGARSPEEARDIAALSAADVEAGMADLQRQAQQREAMRGVGQDMGDGVAQGFRDRQAHMQAEVSAVMASLPATARTDMQIKSPSRVFAEIGQHMADGVTVGLDSGAGGVRSAMSNVVAPPSLPGFGGMGAGGGITVGDINITVQGGTTNEETGASLRASMEEFFVGLMERAQLSAGA